MNVFIVSLEWNDPPSEVTGDTGIEGVFIDKASADARAHSERVTLERDDNRVVYNFTNRAGRYCAWCGTEQAYDVASDSFSACTCGAGPDDQETYCDHCCAELTDTESCLNDHDEWEVDVHVTEHHVVGTTPEEVAR